MDNSSILVQKLQFILEVLYVQEVVTHSNLLYNMGHYLLDIQSKFWWRLG